MASLRQQLEGSCTTISTFNIFETNTPLDDDDEYEHKTQIISTRFFIVVLIISLVILVIYTSQTQTTHIITVNAPSIAIYSSLYQQYGEKLTCPCTTIATAQKEFISVRSALATLLILLGRKPFMMYIQLQILLCIIEIFVFEVFIISRCLHHSVL